MYINLCEQKLKNKFQQCGQFSSSVYLYISYYFECIRWNWFYTSSDLLSFKNRLLWKVLRSVKNMSYYYNAKFLLLKTFWIIFHNSIYKNWKISFYTFTLFCFFFHYFRLYIIYNFWDICSSGTPAYGYKHKNRPETLYGNTKEINQLWDLSILNCWLMF